MVRARFPGKPSRYFARKSVTVDVNHLDSEGCSVVTQLIKDLSVFNRLCAKFKVKEDCCLGFTQREICIAAKKAGEKVTFKSSEHDQKDKRKVIPGSVKRNIKLKQNNRTSSKVSSENRKRRTIKSRLTPSKSNNVRPAKSNRLREKIKREAEKTQQNEVPVQVEPVTSTISVDEPTKKSGPVDPGPNEVHNGDISEDKVPGCRQFVLPSRSVHSSRVIKPNKRFIDLPPPVVMNKKPRLSTNSSKVILRKPKLKLKCESLKLEGPFSANGQSLLTIAAGLGEEVALSGRLLGTRVAPIKPVVPKISNSRHSKGPKPTSVRSSAVNSGPRVKHVCRTASQVLKLASSHSKEESDSKSVKFDQTVKEQVESNKASDESCDEFDPSQNPEDTINSYQPARRLQDLSVVGEERATDTTVSLDYWEPYDLDTALLQGLALLLPSSPLTPLPPLCFLCGSAGPHQLDFCSVCCEGYHWFCVPGGERVLRRRTEGGWRCPRCTPCHGCAVVGATLHCADCAHIYHPACAATVGVHPPPNAHHISWVCGECQKCSSCRQNEVEVSVGKLALCKPCFHLRKLGNFCPLCNVCYDNNDFDTKMVECGLCQKWIHAQCEGISDDKYHMLTYLPSNIDFICRGCKAEKGGATWENAVKHAMEKGFAGVLKAIEKKEALLRRDEDAGLLTPTDDATSLRSVVGRIPTYASIVDFDNDVALAVPPSLQPLARRALKLTFPWYDSKSPGGQPLPSSLPASVPVPKSGLKPQAPLREPDNRICLMCRLTGENGPGERLLYCGSGDWLHINCALWSNEVYEEVDGSLQNVYSAISRSRLMRCYACGKKGATVGCCAKACQVAFHFPCALEANALLLESKEVFCTNHAKMAANSPLQKDFLILRSVYVELDRRKLRSTPKDSARLMVGSLVIEHFGEIEEVSDHVDILVPIGFQCSRLWWSSEDPDKLVRYRVRTFTILEDEGLGASLEANFTIDHCGEFTPPPSPRHPVDDRDIAAVISQLVDTVCREPDPGDHLTRVLPPELEEAIFQDLPQDLIAGICLQDIFPDSQMFQTDTSTDKIQKETKNIRGIEELKQVNLKCRLRSSVRLGSLNHSEPLEVKSKSLVQVDGPADSDEDDEQPVKCGRCHRTYRNSDGFSRHLPQCSTESSTEGETSEEEPPSPVASSPEHESISPPSEVEPIIHQEQCFTRSQIVASNTQCFSNGVTDMVMGVDYIGAYQQPVQPVQVAAAPLYPTLMIQPPVYPQLVLAPPPPQPATVYVNMETVVSNTILTSGQLVETSSYSTTTHLIHAEPLPQPETYVLVNNQPQILCEPEVRAPDPIVLPAQHLVVPPPPPPVLMKSEVLPPKPVNQVVALPPHKPINQVAALPQPPKPTNRIAVRPLHRAKPVLPLPKPTNRVAAKPIQVSIPDSKPVPHETKPTTHVLNRPLIQNVPDAVKPVTVSIHPPPNQNGPSKCHELTSRVLVNSNTHLRRPSPKPIPIEPQQIQEPLPKKVPVLKTEPSNSVVPPITKPLPNGVIEKPVNSLSTPLVNKPLENMNSVGAKVPLNPVNKVNNSFLPNGKSVNPVSSNPINTIPVMMTVNKNGEKRINGEENLIFGEAEKKQEQPKVSYEITCDDGFTFSTDNITEAWEAVYDKVQKARMARGLEPLKENPFSEGDATLRRLMALGSSSVRYIVEQLPGVSNTTLYKPTWHRRRFGTIPAPPVNSSGSARTEQISGPRRRDMFGWLASRHRRPPLLEAVPTNPNANRRAGSISLPMAMRYRHLKESAKRSVGVFRSDIHGRGLFCLRDIDAGEMVIEYAGEVIRSSLTDSREHKYNEKGIGCYMFRIDDKQVVDATMRGNAARFINHSCEPNCYSRIIDILGKKHILIFALRRIKQGEELTYDYKFPLEDDKISCHCLSRKCRKYLN